MTPLSVIVITKNEEKRLASCLESVSFADEIIVVDSQSTDRTQEIARRFTQKVFSRPFDNFAAQKNCALEKAAHEWVLSIDADECVTPSLKEKIIKIVGSGNKEYQGYAVKRDTVLFGKQMRFAGLQNDAPVRLFRRQDAVFVNAIHETVSVKGSVGYLKESLSHASFQRVSEHLDRLQRYTALEEGAKPSVSAFWLRPARRFVSMYFLNQGFRDGFEGFLYSALSAYYEFVRWAKIWERKLYERA